MPLTAQQPASIETQGCYVRMRDSSVTPLLHNFVRNCEGLDMGRN